jgi:hypothetical protein
MSAGRATMRTCSNSCISMSSICKRPAVSMMTTLKAFSRACLSASLAIVEAGVCVPAL